MAPEFSRLHARSSREGRPWGEPLLCRLYTLQPTLACWRCHARIMSRATVLQGRAGGGGGVGHVQGHGPAGHSRGRVGVHVQGHGPAGQIGGGGRGSCPGPRSTPLSPLQPPISGQQVADQGVLHQPPPQPAAEEASCLVQRHDAVQHALG